MSSKGSSHHIQKAKNMIISKEDRQTQMDYNINTLRSLGRGNSVKSTYSANSHTQILEII